MYRSICALGTLVVLLTASEALADSPSTELGEDWALSLDGQFRPRLVFDTNKDFRDTRNNEWVTQRARLGLTLKERTGLAFTLRLQDVRIWGEETDTLNDFSADGFDAHEAFVAIPLSPDELTLKIGRQEIVMDNHRLVGNVDWTQRGRAFDGARLTWTFAPMTVDVFYAKVREAEEGPDGNVPVVVEDDIDFGGVHSSIEVAKGHTVSPMYLLNANSGAFADGGDLVRHTAGVNATGGIDGFAYTAELYYQFGKLEDPARGDRKVSTFMGALNAGYTADLPMKPGIAAWGEYLKGDGTPEGTFDTLYATNHKFYGEADYFINIPVNTANLGLMDVGGRLSAAFTKTLKANVDFHHFRATQSDPAGQSVFGNELDAKLQWAAMEHVTLRGLYGLFLPGEAMRSASAKAPASGDLSAEHFFYAELDTKF